MVTCTKLLPECRQCVYLHSNCANFVYNSLYSEDFDFELYILDLASACPCRCSTKTCFHL